MARDGGAPSKRPRADHVTELHEAGQGAGSVPFSQIQMTQALAALTLAISTLPKAVAKEISMALRESAEDQQDSLLLF